MTTEQNEIKLHIELVIKRELTPAELELLLVQNFLDDSMILTYDDAEELIQVLLMI